MTGIEDIGICIQKLKDQDWQLERAIQGVFEPSSLRQSNRENVSDDLAIADEPETVPLLPTASSVASAPSEPPRIRANAVQRPPQPSMLALLTTPVTWGFRFIWSLLAFTLSFFPFLGLGRRNRRTRWNGTSSALTPASRFLEEFDAQYGPKHPAFHQSSYMNALDAAKRDIRYFVAILHSDGHDDTPQFCKETLCSDAFIEFMTDKNCLVWAGNIKEAEAFKVSAVLGATSYPFMALIALKGHKMVVVHRFEGILTTEAYIGKLRRLTDRLDAQLAGLRADRASRDAARRIREQQDAAYQASLRQDEEKARKAQQEEEKQRKEEQDKQRMEQERLDRIEARKRRKIELKKTLPAEPASDTPSNDVARIGIRLPNGQRLVRRFHADDAVQSLWNFIETHDLSPLPLDADFIIVNPYPRKEYLDMTVSLREANLVPSASVVVE